MRNANHKDHQDHQERVPGGPHKNALKHGLRSAAVLLPGDDVAAFKALRRELFADYQPCTREEADCVENIVGYKWRIAHCQQVQARFRAALNTVTGVHPPAEHLCEPDPHRWQHRSDDCTREESRLHRLMTRDRRTFFELQHLRRHRLVDGALHVTATWQDFMGENEPAEPEETIAQPASEPGAMSPATGSTDGRTNDFSKRTAAQIGTQFPSPAVAGEVARSVGGVPG